MPNFTTENVSAEYNIYYAENANYDELINSFVNIQFENNGSHEGFSTRTSFDYLEDMSVTALSDGNLVAVWTDNIWKDVGDGTWSSTSEFHRDHDVFYRVFNPNNAPITERSLGTSGTEPLDGTFITDEIRVTDTLKDERAINETSPQGYNRRSRNRPCS